MALSKKRKEYERASERFPREILIRYILREYPNFAGPIVVGQFVDALFKKTDELYRFKEMLKPGQMVWYALDVQTRITSQRVNYKPVILTLVAPEDIERHCRSLPQRLISAEVVARLCLEAYEQKVILSMRDLSLILSCSMDRVSRLRQEYERRHNVVLPHQGSYHDMGGTTTHKDIILRKVIIEGKDPAVVAREVNHSQSAVDRYLMDYNRVRYCYEQGMKLEEIVVITALSSLLVKKYISIIKSHMAQCV